MRILVPHSLAGGAVVATVKGRGTEVASGLPGTGLFLGQTLKTQGRTRSA